MSGRKLLDPKTVRPEREPRVISSIGKLRDRDRLERRHNSGIYSFDYLRS